LFGLVISSAENKINFRFLGFGFWVLGCVYEVSGLRMKIKGEDEFLTEKTKFIKRALGRRNV